MTTLIAGELLELADLAGFAGEKLNRLPWVLRILLENALRHDSGNTATARSILAWLETGTSSAEIPFYPGRLLMHDTTCVPALVDIAAMRSELSEAGHDPSVLNPKLPIDVSVDHSIAVDYFGTPEALQRNMAQEIQRNEERYRLLKWATRALRGVRVHPPGTGIMHTMNLELLATVVTAQPAAEGSWVYPDTLIGTDSHTPMINGIGVLAWGVGGVEAESVMFGMPVMLKVPEVIGVRMTGALPEGTLATDLALTVTERLRALRLSGKFVEFFGPGVSTLSCGERAGDGPPNGAVAIAAITSCTNTSDPRLVIAAGLLARKARQFGLAPPPWVKTSLAPGSPAAESYLRRSGLLEDLEALGFGIVGFGCTTCIGNSGALVPEMAEAVENDGVLPVAVLSGNRNFPGRVHPQIEASFLASPPLVVAYALAGHVNLNILDDPVARTSNGRPIQLRDLWPTGAEIDAALAASLRPADIQLAYQQAHENESWRELDAPSTPLFPWRETSTYIRRPPFASRKSHSRLGSYKAHPLLVLGDDITTDHISPAGHIPANSAAAQYLVARGEDPKDLNVFAARRGNWEVMLRGVFTNRSVRNLLDPRLPPGSTIHASSGSPMPLWLAAQSAESEGTSLVVVAGERYGTGSSRDWAAKGLWLLGVRAVLALSFERIHRSNLIGLGIIPLQLPAQFTPAKLALAARDTLEIKADPTILSPGACVPVIVHRAGDAGATSIDQSFMATAAIETALEDRKSVV